MRGVQSKSNCLSDGTEPLPTPATLRTAGTQAARARQIFYVAGPNSTPSVYARTPHCAVPTAPGRRDHVAHHAAPQMNWQHLLTATRPTTHASLPPTSTPPPVEKKLTQHPPVVSHAPRCHGRRTVRRTPIQGGERIMLIGRRVRGTVRARHADAYPADAAAAAAAVTRWRRRGDTVTSAECHVVLRTRRAAATSPRLLCVVSRVRHGTSRSAGTYAPT